MSTTPARAHDAGDDPPRPVDDRDRITALDVARGVALLGILTVNIHYMGWPLGDLLATHTPPKDVSVLEYGAWYYLRTFGEGKFFTIYSTLFGAGLTLQWMRARDRGFGFGWMAARRLGFLLVLGLLHALLLWFGDILFIYGCVGVLLLVPLLLRWSARVQVAVAVCLILVGSLAWGGMSAAQGWGTRAMVQPLPQTHVDTSRSDQPAGVQTPPAVAQGFEATPFGQLWTHWQSGSGSGGPDDPVWRDNEVRAYREGPWLQSFLFRVVTWIMMMIMTLFGFSFGVLGMFLIGSALIKADVFRRAPNRFFSRLALYGWGVGIPLSMAGTWMLSSPNPVLREFLADALFLVTGPLVALGTIALITLWVRSGRAAVVARLIANAGRFGLTNYLLETVVCTFIFYHWGLGKFGAYKGPAMIGIAVCVWLVLVVLSTFATRYLRYGPLEWIWRTVTYLRPQPFLRRASARTDGTHA